MNYGSWIWAVGIYIIYFIRRASLMSRPFVVALAQISAEQEKTQTIAKAVRLIHSAGEQGADLVVFPEIGMTQFFPQFRADPSWFEVAEAIPGGPTSEAVSAAAAEANVAVVVSIFECAIDGVYYDTAAVFNRDGSLSGVQRMMHIAEEPGYNEKFYYKPGNSAYPVFEVAGAKVGVAVCQDQFFPEHIRLLTLHGAEIIAVPTAIAAESDPMLLASRSGAALNQVFFAGSNRVGTESELTFIGKSHVVDPTGEIVAISTSKEDDLLIVPIDLAAVREVRQRQNYWIRDRRPETYSDLVNLVF